MHGIDGVKVVEGLLEVGHGHILVQLTLVQQVNVEVKALQTKPKFFFFFNSYLRNLLMTFFGKMQKY